MRMLVFALAFSLVAGHALAQRPSTLAMSCRQVQTLVAQNGAAVLSTGQHTYDRFVAHRGYCLPGEFFDYEWIPAADGQCRLQVRLNDAPIGSWTEPATGRHLV